MSKKRKHAPPFFRFFSHFVCVIFISLQSIGNYASEILHLGLHTHKTHCNLAAGWISVDWSTEQERCTYTHIHKHKGIRTQRIRHRKSWKNGVEVSQQPEIHECIRVRVRSVCVAMIPFEIETRVCLYLPSWCGLASIKMKFYQLSQA